MNWFARTTPLWLLKEAHDLACWLCIQFGKAKADQLPAFTQPSAPGKADARASRQILDKLAAQEAQMEALLSELEQARSKVSAAEKEAAEIKELSSVAQAAADELHFSEAETRTRLIDSFLASAGWDVGEGLTSSEQVGKEVALDGQPTTTGTGYADYVLWDDNGNPLAVIEAKKTAVDAERGRHQAKLYANSLENTYRHRPVIFYTNGFDIWIWDDAQNFPPRKLYGFYSKDSLQHLVNYQRAQKKPLDTIEINEQIVDRLYQMEAIKRVAERFAQKHRKVLIVQGDRHWQDAGGDRAHRSSDPSGMGEARPVLVRPQGAAQAGEKRPSTISCQSRSASSHRA